VLLTAAAGNPASLRVIEANAGVADGEAISPISGERMLRYWIDLGG
jgi:predicted acetyltransferase